VKLQLSYSAWKNKPKSPLDKTIGLHQTTGTQAISDELLLIMPLTTQALETHPADMVKDKTIEMTLLAI
jgi:hypothetical protein